MSSDFAFTERLEPALTILANQPARMLHYMEDRFELETGELQEWLNEFNGGQKALKFARIHEMKQALAHGHPVPAFVPPPAPAPAAPEPERNAPCLARDRAAPPPLAPEPETPAEVARRETMQRAGRQPKAPQPHRAGQYPKPMAKPSDTVGVERAENVTPSRSTTSAAPTVSTAVKNDEQPWLTKSFRGLTYRRWRPVLVELLTPGAVAKEVCKRHDKSDAALHMYVKAWLRRHLGGLDPVHLQAFLIWADAQCGMQIAPTEATPVRSKPDAWEQWRADAIAALVTMGTRATRATTMVDRAIANLHGKDCEVGELVKLALRESGEPPAKPGSTAKPAHDNGAARPQPAARSPQPAARSPQPAARSPQPAARSPQPAARSGPRDPWRTAMRDVLRALTTLQRLERSSRSTGRRSGSSCSSGSCR